MKHNKWDLRWKGFHRVVGVVTSDWILDPAKPAAPEKRLEAAPGHEVMGSVSSSEEGCGNGRGGKRGRVQFPPDIHSRLS